MLTTRLASTHTTWCLEWILMPVPHPKLCTFAVLHLWREQTVCVPSLKQGLIPSLWLLQLCCDICVVLPSRFPWGENGLFTLEEGEHVIKVRGIQRTFLLYSKNAFRARRSDSICQHYLLGTTQCGNILESRIAYSKILHPVCPSLSLKSGGKHYLAQWRDPLTPFRMESTYIWPKKLQGNILLCSIWCIVSWSHSHECNWGLLKHHPVAKSA